MKNSIEKIRIIHNPYTACYERAAYNVPDEDCDIVLSVKKNESTEAYQTRAFKLMDYLNYGLTE